MCIYYKRKYGAKLKIPSIPYLTNREIWIVIYEILILNKINKIKYINVFRNATFIIFVFIFFP